MQKEAIMIVLDIGHRMLEPYKHDETKTCLQIAIDCIILMTQQKIFNQKSHELGLVLFGCDKAANGNVYIQDICKPNLEFIKNVKEIPIFERQNKPGGDIFNALSFANDQLDSYVKKKKYDKKIFLFTCGQGSFSFTDNKIYTLGNDIYMNKVKVNFIAINFMSNHSIDDETFEFVQDHYESHNQNQNKKGIFQIARSTNKDDQPTTSVFPAKIAISLYQKIRSKQPTNRVSWRGEFQLTQGLQCNVGLYKKCVQDTMPSLKKFSKAASYSNDEKANKVAVETQYMVQEGNALQSIDKEQIIKGYQYGKQLVPISKMHEEEMKLKSEKCLKLLGFVSQSKIPRQAFLSPVDMMTSDENRRDQLTLNSLIHACLVLQKAAIVRYQYSKSSNPTLAALFPHKSDSYSCFWMVQLPTVESIRDYQFNSLKESNPQQKRVVADFVKGMRLSDFSLKHCFNPVKQYLFQSVFHKVHSTDPNAPLPELDPVITRYLKPEIEKYKENTSLCQQLIQQFKLIKIEQKEKQNKIFWKSLITKDDTSLGTESQTSATEMNYDENDQEIIKSIQGNKKLFRNDDEPVTEISKINPIDDFKEMVNNPKEDLVVKAIQQISALILDSIQNSSKDQSFHGKALECLQVLRATCKAQDEARAFNDLILKIKQQHSNPESPQVLMWKLIISQAITLISKEENKKSEFSQKQCMEFLQNEDKKMQEVKVQISKEADDDLLDLLD